MEKFKDLPVSLFESREAWQDWLHKHHTQTQGLWLKLAKKASGRASVSYAEAVDEALCYGWIDAQKASYDSDYWLQKFTPRRPKSIWSKVNIAKVELLLKANKMQPAGLVAVETAKQTGAWQAAYDSSSMMLVPEDFQTELDKNPVAKQFFLTLNKAGTYAFCWRIQTAQRPETRQARIKKFINMLNKGEKLH
jgi:uncharacterized protein YdeI (YjbR/CyaY-like superfamily)